MSYRDVVISPSGKRLKHEKLKKVIRFMRTILYREHFSFKK